MFHREQKTNFRVSEFSLSGAFLHTLLKPRFGTFDIGALFEYVADALWHTVGGMTDRVDFTLVNACSPFTRFSHGSSLSPPASAWPSGKALILTFAISSTRTYERRIIGRGQVRHNSNSITKWGLDYNSNDFISISVDMTMATEWGIHSLRANQLQYVYNMIGAMTKNFVRRQAQYLTAEQSYEDHHEVRSIRDWYVELYSLPLKQLFTQVPYHLWPFNYHIWEYCPNILPLRTITPVVAIYYFMYLNSVGVPNNSAANLRTGLSGDKGIAGHLSDSILRMVQDIRTPGDRQISTLERLAPAVIETFLRTGSTQLEDGSFNYYASQEAARKRLIVDMQMREHDLGQLFLPARDVSIKLMRQNVNWRDTLNRALEFPQIDLTSN